MYKFIVRPILFWMNPEFVHHLVVFMLKTGTKIPGVYYLLKKTFSAEHSSLERNVFGYKFKNPVGLAAGFDKNAEFFNEFSSFGFSFIEIGTVTPKPQPGNPKPRLFRVIPDKGIINRMGFNNKGVNYVKYNLTRNRKKNLIIGGNIGKNTLTPNSEAVNDYLACFNELYPLVDYIVVNISCPNVTNLRELQEGSGLKDILDAIINARKQFDTKKPILLKVSPDLTNDQIDDTLNIAEAAGIDGYVATNTTTSRNNLTIPTDRISAIGNGGLSGAPINNRSTEVIRYINSKLNGSKPIIGVGGIMTPKDAIEKLEAGASLIQVYTGFIYEGPAIVNKINKALIKNNIDKIK